MYILWRRFWCRGNVGNLGRRVDLPSAAYLASYCCDRAVIEGGHEVKSEVLSRSRFFNVIFCP